MAHPTERMAQAAARRREATQDLFANVLKDARKNLLLIANSLALSHRDDYPDAEDARKLAVATAQAITSALDYAGVSA